MFLVLETVYSRNKLFPEDKTTKEKDYDQCCNRVQQHFADDFQCTFHILEFSGKVSSSLKKTMIFPKI